MKNGKCPMCNSTEVYTNPEAQIRASNSVELRDFENRVLVQFIPYVCIKCGFVAMFANDMNAIKDLPDKKGWEQVK